MESINQKKAKTKKRIKKDKNNLMHSNKIKHKLKKKNEKGKENNHEKWMINILNVMKYIQQLDKKGKEIIKKSKNKLITLFNYNLCASTI